MGWVKGYWKENELVALAGSKVWGSVAGTWRWFPLGPSLNRYLSPPLPSVRPHFHAACQVSEGLYWGDGEGCPGVTRLNGVSHSPLSDFNTFSGLSFSSPRLL